MIVLKIARKVAGSRGCILVMGDFPWNLPSLHATGAAVPFTYHRRDGSIGLAAEPFKSEQQQSQQPPAPHAAPSLAARHRAGAGSARGPAAGAAGAAHVDGHAAQAMRCDEV